MSSDQNACNSSKTEPLRKLPSFKIPGSSKNNPVWKSDLVDFIVISSESKLHPYKVFKALNHLNHGRYINQVSIITVFVQRCI